MAFSFGQSIHVWQNAFEKNTNRQTDRHLYEIQVDFIFLEATTSTFEDSHYFIWPFYRSIAIYVSRICLCEWFSFTFHIVTLFILTNTIHQDCEYDLWLCGSISKTHFAFEAKRLNQIIFTIESISECCARNSI